MKTNYTFRLRNFVEILSFLMIVFWGCGTENDSDLNAESAETPSLLIGRAEGFMDPQSGEVFISPVSEMARMGQMLFLSHSDQAYLSLVNPNVGLQGWFTSSFDEVNQTAFLFQGPGACLTNLESRTITNLQARFSNFSHPEIRMGHGAITQGSDFIVRYQSLPSQETFCRGFSLTIPSGVPASFLINFEAANLSDLVPARYVSKVEAVRLSYEPPRTSIRVSGRGFTGNGVRPPTVLLDNVLRIPYSSFNKSEILLSIGRPLDDFATANGGEGFLSVQTQASRGDPRSPASFLLPIPGSYLMQPQIVRAGLRLPSGLGNRTKKVFWRACKETAQSGCVIVDGCLHHTDSSPLESAEFAANTPLSDAQANLVSMTSTFTTASPSGSHAHVWFGFDLNGDNVVDAGDLYGQVSPVTLPRGQIVDLGEQVLTETVQASCGL